ncbi:MAG: ADP-ribosylation/Crystallin [Bacillales bacterium]|jgi:hypothetical protein|nr:ADP-ribosylation/Crystallin [Bacillales bacterium]
MEKYEKLLKFIDYFEDDTQQICTWEKEDRVIVMGYPNYDNLLIEFIDAVHEVGILRTDYLDYLEKNIDNSKQQNENIATADIDLLRAILTYYVRQERFVDGSWNNAAKDKTFLSILYRLEQLLKLDQADV